MPTPTSPSLPTRTQILHIYRSLLREASYLPLPTPRTYFHKYISTQFQTQLPKINTLLSNATPSVPYPIAVERARRLHRRARHLLSVLTRANHGHHKPFNRVLSLAYARAGPRRRALMNKILHPEQHIDEDSAQQTDPPTNVARITPADSNIQIPPLVSLLLQSQRRQQSHFLHTAYKILPSGPQLPEQTIWGKPLPRSRVRNAWKRWYAEYVDRLFVPLSEDEWKEVKEYAQGEKVVEVKEPRKIGRVRVFAEEGPKNAGKDDSTSEEGVVRNVLLDPKLKQKPLIHHTITPRFVQRRMAELLVHIPHIINEAADMAGADEQEETATAKEATTPEPPRIAVQWLSQHQGQAIPIREMNDSQMKTLFGSCQ